MNHAEVRAVKVTDPQDNSSSESAAPVARVKTDKTANWGLTGDRTAMASLKCVLSG